MKNIAVNIVPRGPLAAAVGFTYLALLALVAPAALANQPGPRERVEQATDALFEVVREYRGETESDEFYRKVTEVLDPVVDFAFIARGVMGDYGKEASDEQKQTFAATFKEGLVKTYARGIEGYVDAQVRVVPLEEELGDRRRVSIDQEVRDNGSVYHLSYTMARNRAGEWKLINLVLDGVNLGKSFRSQFAQAMRKYDNDLDKVIDNWLSEVE